MDLRPEIEAALKREQTARAETLSVAEMKEQALSFMREQQDHRLRIPINAALWLSIEAREALTGFITSVNAAPGIQPEFIITHFEKKRGILSKTYEEVGLEGWIFELSTMSVGNSNGDSFEQMIVTPEYMLAASPVMRHENFDFEVDSLYNNSRMRSVKAAALKAGSYSTAPDILNLGTVGRWLKNTTTPLEPFSNPDFRYDKCVQQVINKSAQMQLNWRG